MHRCIVIITSRHLVPAFQKLMPARRPPPPPDPDDDPLAAFELPPDVMSQTFEHAISDVASVAHERGHAVAAGLQRKLKGSMVEYGFPGIVTAHLPSGASKRRCRPSPSTAARTASTTAERTRPASSRRGSTKQRS